MAYATSNAGTFNWFFQRISGVFIAVILAIHLGAVHFGSSPVDLGSPAWKVFHLFFVLVLIYHIMNGVWLMVEDYVPTPWLRVSLYGLVWSVGVVFLILGFVTLVPFGA